MEPQTLYETILNGEDARKVRILLINPNTSQDSTALMLRVAREAAGADVEIEGLTAPFGFPFITDEEALATAAKAVVAALDRFCGPKPDGVVIAGFGDPALEQIRNQRAFEVVGLAEASMMEAAEGDRMFSVATTTPNLVGSIERCAARYGLGENFLSVRTTPGDAQATMADAASLRRALEKIAKESVEQDGAEAVIIGGGPLADAAQQLAKSVAVPVIEPIPAALRLLLSKCRRRS
jgi:allantoin racemase